MEAVWTRFMPVYQQVREWLDTGIIGDVRMVQASFGFASMYDPDSRLYNPDLAGGAMLDVGIYPVTLSQWVFQKQPIEIATAGHIGSSQVDEQVVIALKYAGGGLSQLGASISTSTAHDAWIFGGKGKIHLQTDFWSCEAATWIYDEPDLEDQAISIPHAINGYEYEIVEVHKCLTKGRLESPKMTWATSLAVLDTIDRVRSQLGLVYPFEN